MKKSLCLNRPGAARGLVLSLLPVAILLCTVLMGCPPEVVPCRDYDPNIPSEWASAVDNPYFPLTPGTIRTYEADTDDGLERVVVEVTDQTREVMGMTCVVVRDTVTVDGEVEEDTFDWFAQDAAGNVWYMGEDSREYEDGLVVSTEGSWEAGIDGALPGIQMLATPEVGEPYFQEFYCGEAEDEGQVTALNESVTVPAGSYVNCVEIAEFTRLEPDLLEYKYYAPGIGFVLAMEDDVRVELVSIVQP